MSVICIHRAGAFIASSYSFRLKNPPILNMMTTGSSSESDMIVVAKRASIGVPVTKGETKFWCSCGRSSKQPFCDGSHAGTSFTPVKYVAEESESH
jgi:CDGSH-type Zn-finger protein